MSKERLGWIYPMADSSSTRNKVESCKNIIESSLFEIGNFKDVYVDIENNWSTENDSRILRRELHTNYFLEDFAHSYIVTEEPKYLNYSFRLLENWIETFPTNKIQELDPLAYHDEGTAIRLLFWFKYYYKLYDVLNDQQKEILNINIKEQIKVLLDESFYSGINNHGMFQDIAIIAFSIFDSEEFYEKQVFKTSLQRIEQYFKEVFTSEGVHKEHAPSYHILVLHNLKHIILALRNADYKDEKVNYLESIYKKGEEYIINVTMPNFKLPKISDSTETDMTKTFRYKELFDSEEYKYVTSGGIDGNKPSGKIASYPESGYFIARNGWERSSGYLLFLASYHMHYHKHTDDLSFILYKNQPIFIDSGPHSYNYKDEMTKYGYSSFAHSTLILNDASLPRTDYKFDDVYIKEFNIENEDFSVTGINNRFKDATHSRNITGNIEEYKYRITDIIESKKRNQYKILFQISGDLDLYKHGNIVSIFKQNSKIGELELIEKHGCDNLGIEIISAQKYPNIMGYEFPKKEEIKSSNVVVIEAYNKRDKCEIVTHIRLQDFKITGGATYNHKAVEVNYNDINYIFHNNNRNKLAVIFSPTDQPYKYATEHRFDKLDEKFNLLIIKDVQSSVGSSFIAGKTNSSIESDIIEVIYNHVNQVSIKPDDIIFIGKSKAGFAAIYYGLKLNIKNIYAISPLTAIGDFYSRHEKLKPVINHLAGNLDIGSIKYLNNYLYKLKISKVQSKITIGIGELDYHYKKHIVPLEDWFDFNSIDYNIKKYKDKKFTETDIFIENFINEFILNP